MSSRVNVVSSGKLIAMIADEISPRLYILIGSSSNYRVREEHIYPARNFVLAHAVISCHCAGNQYLYIQYLYSIEFAAIRERMYSL